MTHLEPVINEIAKRVADALGLTLSDVFIDRPVGDGHGPYAELGIDIQMAPMTLCASEAILQVSISASMDDDGRPVLLQRMEKNAALWTALTWTGRSGNGIPCVKKAAFEGFAGSEPLENPEPKTYGVAARWQGSVSVDKG